MGIVTIPTFSNFKLNELCLFVARNSLTAKESIVVWSKERRTCCAFFKQQENKNTKKETPHVLNIFK